MTDRVDVLVLAAHPDDAELGCGGTILDLVARGRSIAIVDLTRGERATRGTAEQRAEETARASALLGLRARRNLGLPDSDLAADDRATRAVVAVLRELRPALLMAQAEIDAHPDHRAAAAIARRAFFLAGLRNAMPEVGEPHRPRSLLFYLGNDFGAPSCCVDISAHVERKRDVVRCYASQLGGDRSHQLRGLDPLERCEARDRYFGSIVGVAAAEPFVVDGPLPLQSLVSLL